jgi:hypothetical protein
MSVIVKNTEKNFDLSGIAQDVLAEMANGAASNVERNLQSAVQNAITAGRALIAAKSQCQHGQWLPWLKHNWKFAPSLAQRYMQMSTGVEICGDASSIAEALRMIADAKPKIQNRTELEYVYADVDVVASQDGFDCAECDETLDAPAKHCDECGEHFTGSECDCKTAVDYEEDAIVQAVIDNAEDEFEVVTERPADDVEVVSVTLKEK